jgi:hypothetical protein
MNAILVDKLPVYSTGTFCVLILKKMRGTFMYVA